MKLQIKGKENLKRCQRKRPITSILLGAGQQLNQRLWQDIFKRLQEKYFLTQNLYPVKFFFFLKKDKINTVQN